MFVEVPRVEYEKLVEEPTDEGSQAVRQRVEAARRVQRERFKVRGLSCNAEMGPDDVWHCCVLEESGKALLQAAMNQLSLSARGFHRVLKLARTIADLSGAEGIGAVHLAEALQYRSRG